MGERDHRLIIERTGRRENSRVGIMDFRKALFNS